MSAKKLVWQKCAQGRHGHMNSKTAIGTFEISSELYRPFGATLNYGAESRAINNEKGGARFETIEDAKAACQNEFNRIHANISGSPWRPASEIPKEGRVLVMWIDKRPFVALLPLVSGNECVTAWMPIPPIGEHE